MSDPKKLQVHLSNSGSPGRPGWMVEIIPHPSVAKRNIHVVFNDVEIHNWRRPGVKADWAEWISRELDDHADDPNNEEREEEERRDAKVAP